MYSCIRVDSFAMESIKEIVATHPFPVEASIYNDVVQLNLSLGGETHHASRFVERRLAAIIA